MVEAMIPAGATIAAFVMTVIGWYAMLRTGVQLIHDDLQGRKYAREEIENMILDLTHQEQSFRDWKKEWHILEQTPDEILRQIWGTGRFDIISQKLRYMKTNIERARNNLGPLSNIAASGTQAQGRISRPKQTYYTFKFVWTKKKYIRELLNGWLADMTVIKDASSAGWLEQKQRLNRSIVHATPYHAQVAHLLVKIALHTHNDAESLRPCFEMVKDEVAAVLDLDLFDAVAAITENEHAEKIAQTFGAGHLKLDLLLRETSRQRGELTRVSVETAPGGTTPESRVIDALRAILGPERSQCHFLGGLSTLFCLTKVFRPANSCSLLHQTFRDVLANNVHPDYNPRTKRFVYCELILGDLSQSRAAFELAQACLLFLRTTWLTCLCRCGLRCGLLPNVPATKWHQFGLEIVDIEHQPPVWRDPHHPGGYEVGSSDQSWCAIDFRWFGLNKPVRRLGLLLVEFSLGTVVYPGTDDSAGDGTAPVTHVYVRCKDDQHNLYWVNVARADLTRLVRKSFNDNDHVARAVEYCLTAPLPVTPCDAEWETTLTDFYFKVVAPFRDLYYMKLGSGLLSPL